MTLKRTLLGLTIVVAASLYGACATVSVGGNSNTNWLRSCDTDANCGDGLSCICGTCTQLCGATRCMGDAAHADCVVVAASVASTACAAPPAGPVCSLVCTSNADCASAGGARRCVGGACLAGSAKAGSAKAGGTPDGSVPPCDAGSCRSMPENDGVAPVDACGATPRVLSRDVFPPEVSAQSVTVAVALDVRVNATDLYYALNGGALVVDHPIQHGYLVRLSLLGGTPELVTNIVGSEGSMLLTPTSVVFSETFPDPKDASRLAGDIVRVALDGSNRTVLATTSGSAGDVATDGTDVYFEDESGTKAVPLVGGAVRVLTAKTGTMALVGSKVIIADPGIENPDGTSSGSIFSISSNGQGALQTLATHQSGAGLPVGCGGTPEALCWLTGVNPRSSGAPDAGEARGSLVRMTAGGSLQTLASSPALYSTYRLIFDGSDFFATAIEALGPWVYRIPGSGGDLVLAGPSLPFNLGSGAVVDDHCLYVVAEMGGVSSVVKTYIPPTH